MLEDIANGAANGAEAIDPLSENFVRFFDPRALKADWPALAV